MSIFTFTTECIGLLLNGNLEALVHWLEKKFGRGPVCIQRLITNETANHRWERSGEVFTACGQPAT